MRQSIKGPASYWAEILTLFRHKFWKAIFKMDTFYSSGRGPDIQQCL